jgi:hypothetical protein
MRDRLRGIRPATAIALLALFVSLSGTATAITLITGRNVKDGSLTGQDIRDRSLTKADLRSGTLSGSRGPAGPVGPQGEQGEAGLRGAQGTQGAAGADPWDRIPSGQVVKGSGHFRLYGTANGELAVTVQLPAQAPVALTTGTVNFSGGDPVVGDVDNTCGGTDTAPIPTEAGKVCIYVSQAPLPNNVKAGSANGDRAPDGTSAFTVHWDALADGITEFAFTWAYQAP